MALRQRQVPISSKNSFQAQRAHARAKQAFKTYDTSAIRPKRSKVPYIIVAVVVIAVIAAIFLIAGSCQPKVEGSLPADEQAVIVVEEGESAAGVGLTLEEAGLVGEAAAFTDLVKEKNAAASIIPGAYVFNGKTSIDDILQALMVGPSATGVTLTIPEGFTRQAISEAVESATNGRISAQSFMDASADAQVYASDYDFLKDAGNNNLEGFLFPKTYNITAGDDAEAVVRMMLNQFGADTAAIDWSYPEREHLNRYEALILASIVEKEAAADNRVTVASVFYNRLNSNPPYLQSDATTAYEVGHDPTGEEVHADTPYSTYSHTGLPPTPICNPSLSSIQAVCNPEETDYMYFYSGDGVYTFSRTYDEHQRAYS